MISRSLQQEKSRLALGLLILLAFLIAGCQTGSQANTNEPYQVGLLLGVDSHGPTLEGFKMGMAELGYVEGETIVYDLQAAHGDSDMMKSIVQQFVAEKVDLIVTTSTGGIKAAQTATQGTDIPVVFTIVADPVGGGIVDDLRQPGGNITGVSRPATSFLSKRLEYLQQMAPQTKRLLVPYQVDYPTTAMALPVVLDTAADLGLEAIEMPVNTPAELVANIEQAAAESDPGFDALMVMLDPAVQHPTSWEAMTSLAEQHQLPIVGNLMVQAHNGALFSYTDDDYETGQLAAPLADKILNGAEVDQIPVVFGEPRLYLNYATAQSLGLTVEDGLMREASEIIR